MFEIKPKFAKSQVAQTSSDRVQDLRFGDFDGDRKTEVFGVVSGKWQFSKSATGAWTPRGAHLLL
jgi:hypothetical protein